LGNNTFDKIENNSQKRNEGGNKETGKINVKKATIPPWLKSKHLQLCQHSQNHSHIPAPQATANWPCKRSTASQTIGQKPNKTCRKVKPRSPLNIINLQMRQWLGQRGTWFWPILLNEIYKTPGMRNAQESQEGK
jgi:hypothetical protein